MLGVSILAEMSSFKDHLAMADELEEISFRNRVWFYREEFKAIMDGAPVGEFFTDNQSVGMVKMGYYYLDNKGVDGRHALTEKTLKVLASFEKEP